MLIKKIQPSSVLMGKFEHGSDLFQQITEVAKLHSIKTASVNVIGAVKTAKIGFYKQEEKEYITIDVLDSVGPFEIASCSGNISMRDGVPVPHVHAVFTDRNGKAYGGHLLPGTILFAGEFVINVFDGATFERSLDPVTGLPLWAE